MTSSEMKPLYVYMPLEAWDLVQRIGKARAEEAAGVEPNRADLWREAMMRGLREMLAKVEA